MLAHDIIIKPLLSEKSYAGIKDKKYYFIVATVAELCHYRFAANTVCVFIGYKQNIFVISNESRYF